MKKLLFILSIAILATGCNGEKDDTIYLAYQEVIGEDYNGNILTTTIELKGGVGGFYYIGFHIEDNTGHRVCFSPDAIISVKNIDRKGDLFYAQFFQRIEKECTQDFKDGLNNKNMRFLRSNKAETIYIETREGFFKFDIDNQVFNRILQ